MCVCIDFSEKQSRRWKITILASLNEHTRVRAAPRTIMLAFPTNRTEKKLKTCLK